jgi:hypothetical protein
MKTETREVFIAFDGQQFATAGECRQHERDNAHTLLIGLTFEQISAALARVDLDLAEAIERVGSQIAAARRAAGDMRRKRGAEESTEPPAEEPADNAESAA